MAESFMDFPLFRPGHSAGNSVGTVCCDKSEIGNGDLLHDSVSGLCPF